MWRWSEHGHGSWWSSITLKVQRERVAPEAKDLLCTLIVLSAAGDRCLYLIPRTSTASVEIWALFGDRKMCLSKNPWNSVSSKVPIFLIMPTNKFRIQESGLCGIKGQVDTWHVLILLRSPSSPRSQIYCPYQGPKMFFKDHAQQ